MQSSKKHAGSLFRKDFTLEQSVEPTYQLHRTSSSQPAPPMCNTTNANADDSSSSSLRDHLAGLSLQSSAENAIGRTSIERTTSALRSPGPSSPVVRPSKHDALPEPSSITSLKKMLVEGRIGEHMHPPPTSSIDIPQRVGSVASSDRYVSEEESEEEDLLHGRGDVVLNNSVLENAMKRKRSARKKENVSSSWNSSDAIQPPGMKKLKPLVPDEKAQLPTFHAMNQRNRGTDLSLSAVPHLVGNNIDRIDSFERGTVEHYEGENESVASSSSDGRTDSNSVGANKTVHVIIKWRDMIVDPKTCKMSIVSKDISSVINSEVKPRKIPMEYDPTSKCWTAPNLYLPPGVYKFQFLINGELRHSNFLPTATDSFGNFVNWFEVVPGYDSIEPTREVIMSEGGSSNMTSDDMIQEGLSRPKLEPGRSSSSNWKNSAKHIERTGTPFSDYTGVLSRSGSFRPSMLQNTSSSYDLLAPPKQKQIEYSNEIPELFKVNFDSDTQVSPPPPPQYNKTQPGSEINGEPPSFLHRVQDCNQDKLFADLQQNGKVTPQAAEDLFLQQYSIPDLPVYLDSSFLNAAFSRFQNNNESRSAVNHIVPHVNLNHLLTSSIRDEIISVGCTTRYEGKFITQIIYTPCYYGSSQESNGNEEE